MSLCQFLFHWLKGNKSVLAGNLTEDITCPENTELHESSPCLAVDGQALVVALAKA